MHRPADVAKAVAPRVPPDAGIYLGLSAIVWADYGRQRHQTPRRRPMNPTTRTKPPMSAMNPITGGT